MLPAWAAWLPLRCAACCAADLLPCCFVWLPAGWLASSVSGLKASAVRRQRQHGWSSQLSRRGTRCGTSGAAFCNSKQLGLGTGAVGQEAVGKWPAMLCGSLCQLAAAAALLAAQHVFSGPWQPCISATGSSASAVPDDSGTLPLSSCTPPGGASRSSAHAQCRAWCLRLGTALSAAVGHPPGGTAAPTRCRIHG